MSKMALESAAASPSRQKMRALCWVAGEETRLLRLLLRLTQRRAANKIRWSWRCFAPLESARQCRKLQSRAATAEANARFRRRRNGEIRTLARQRCGNGGHLHRSK